MVIKTGLMTLAEFLALPEEKPYLELIDGEVCQKAVGKKDHANAQFKLGFLLALAERTRRGKVYTELGLPFEGFMPPNHRVPDLSYFLPGRDFPGPYPDPAEPPDLVAEVRSEGQTIASLERRLAFLRERGVRVTLLIDTGQRCVHVNDGGRESKSNDGETVTLEALDGFSFDVAELFV